MFSLSSVASIRNVICKYIIQSQITTAAKIPSWPEVNVFFVSCHSKLTYGQELRQAAEFLGLPELVTFVHNIQTKEEFLNNDVLQQYRQVITTRV